MGSGRGIGGAGQLRVVDQGGSARGRSTWAEAAVARATVPPRRSTLRWTLPRARLGRRQRSIGPGRAVDEGGSARDVGLGRWLRRGPGPGPGRSVGAGRGIGGAGQLASWIRAAQLAAFAWAEAAVARATVPPRRSTLRWTCPGLALGEGSGRSGLGGGSVEDLGMNASTLERIRFAAANRLCVDVGYGGGRANGGAILTAQGSRRQCCAICLRGRLPPNVLPIELAAFSEVEVTRQTFVPKYANELLSPGR